MHILTPFSAMYSCTLIGKKYTLSNSFSDTSMQRYKSLSKTHQENHMFLFWLYKAIIKPEKAKSRESHSLGVIQQSHDAKK